MATNPSKFNSYQGLGPLSDLKIKTADGDTLEYSKYNLAREFPYYDTMFNNNGFKDTGLSDPIITINLSTSLVRKLLSSIDTKLKDEHFSSEEIIELWSFLNMTLSNTLSKKLRNYVINVCLNDMADYLFLIEAIMLNEIFIDDKALKEIIRSQIYDEYAEDILIYRGMNKELVNLYYRGNGLMFRYGHAIWKYLKANSWKKEDENYFCELFSKETGGDYDIEGAREYIIWAGKQ